MGAESAPRVGVSRICFWGNLNAIAQYYESIFILEIAQRKDEIGAMLLEYWEKHLKTLIPMKDYTIDFTILEGDKIKVIELNNPAPYLVPVFSDGQMREGSWKKDRLKFVSDWNQNYFHVKRSILP